MLRPTRDLSPSQVARLCRVGYQTVRQWEAKGLLKGYVVPGTTHRRFTPAALLRFLKAHGMPVPDDWRLRAAGGNTHTTDGGSR